MYTYAWYHWLTFFYIYCFLGWIFESAYVSAKQQKPVNRGFLRLPMLPLYGTGAVMMLWVSLPVKDSPVLVYLSGVIAATILEYVTGYVMERLFKVRYWDYSNQKYNLHGYICLSSSIAWGFLTIFMTEVIHRPIARLVLSLPFSIEEGILIVISAVFVYDTVHSVREALNFAAALEKVSQIRAELDNIQVQLSLLRAEAAQSVQAQVEQLKSETAQNAQNTQARIAALTERLAERRAALKTHLELRRPAILHRNPGTVSKRFAAALEDMRNSWDARRSE